MPLTAEQQLELARAKAGLGGLTNILGLVSPDSPPAAKAASGLGAVNAASNLSGQFGGPTLPAGVPTALGLGGAGIGLGLSLADIAKSNMSTKQKVGSGGLAATDAVLSLTVPYYAAGVAASALGHRLERSGSPQLRAGGRQILAPLIPIEGLRGVLSGKESPRAAFNSMIQSYRDVPLVGGVLGKMFDVLGLGTRPTTGTMFRSGLQQVFKQLKLQPFDRADKNVYNIDLEKYNSFSTDTRAKAQELGKKLASVVPEYKKNPQAYENQAAVILLNTYGDQVKDLYKQLVTDAMVAGPKTASITVK